MDKLGYALTVIFGIGIFRVFQEPDVRNALFTFIKETYPIVLAAGLFLGFVLFILSLINAPDNPVTKTNALASEPSPPKKQASEKPKQPTVKQNCSHCNGRGETQEYDPCSTCSGTGQVYVNEFNTCLGCGGMGRKLQTKTCRWCNGSGKTA